DIPDTTAPLAGGVFAADRVGLWRTDAGDTGSASLLSDAETRLPGAADAGGVGAAPASPSSEPAGAWGGEATGALLLGVLALLVIESGLYHRFGVT
ncbi:MAG: hypothetical protein HZA54_08730, partial [Planctomycetes bacterium]|nr:hypothetical protein [Planctomycetota bacterium]